MTKPTKYPDWAVHVADGTDNDVVDTTSGQNNVVEPTDTKKETGWLYTEKPPRQHLNWLARLVCQWVRWFDEITSRYRYYSGTFSTPAEAYLPWASLDADLSVDNTIVVCLSIKISSVWYACPALQVTGLGLKAFEVYSTAFGIYITPQATGTEPGWSKDGADWKLIIYKTD